MAAAAEASAVEVVATPAELGSAEVPVESGAVVLVVVVFFVQPVSISAKTTADVITKIFFITIILSQITKTPRVPFLSATKYRKE